MKAAGARRLGDQLALLLRRPQALLRPGGPAHRRLRRRRRLRGAARQQVPPAAAGPALRRAVHRPRGGEARHPDGDRPPREHDEADARVPALPLLRQVRRRLRHGLLLQQRRPPAPVCAEDRQARAALERGRRARAHRRRRPGQRRAVLRPAHRLRAARLRQGGRGRRELRGLHAHPAQLEVRPASQRPRQRLRRDRPLPLRADPPARPRLPAPALRHQAAQRPRHRGRTRLHAALQPPARPQARLPARLRHAVLEHRQQPRRGQPLRAGASRASAPGSRPR